MLTKYIEQDNWKELDFDYINKDMYTESTFFKVAGNLNYSISQVNNKLEDISINNFSAFYLTQQEQLSGIISSKIPTNSYKKLAGIFAVNFVNGYISENTLFVRSDLSTKSLQLVKNSNLDNNCFIDLEFINSKNCVLSQTISGIKYTVVYSPITTQLYLIEYSKVVELSNYFYTFNVIFDEVDKSIMFYVKIKDDIFYITNNFGNLIISKNNTFEVTENNKFTFISYGNNFKFYNSNDYVNYSTDLNVNNLNIDPSKSKYNIANNNLYHFEYNNITNKIPVNVITLKNQLNDREELGYNITSNNNINFRDYDYIHTGGERELGNENIILGYTYKNLYYNFPTNQTTFFHTPVSPRDYNIKIQDSGLIESGAVGSFHPLYSDKIYRRFSDYTSDSYLGQSSGELNGRWLCAWLSAGGPEDTPVWVDRYYNPKQLTKFKALQSPITFNLTLKENSVDSSNTIDTVIDKPSEFYFEKNTYYAYNRAGQKDFDLFKNNLKDNYLLESGISNYVNLNKVALTPYKFNNIDVYDFNGREYGVISTNKIDDNFNTFTLNFFAKSNDWNKPIGYQILGNSLDFGFGIFNYNKATPFIFDFNEKKIFIYNNNFTVINEINYTELLDSNIACLFRRDQLDTFHIITLSGSLYEIDLRGTVVDFNEKIKDSNLPINNTIVDYINDTNYGYILFSNNTLVKIDLLSNETEIISNVPTYNRINNGFNKIIVSNNDYFVLEAYKAITYVNKVYYIKSSDKRTIYFYDTFTGKGEVYYRSPAVDINDFIFDDNFKTIILKNNKTIDVLDVKGISSNTYSLSTVSSDITNLYITHNFNNGELEKHLLCYSDSNINKIDYYSYSIIGDSYKVELYNKNDITNFKYIFQNIIPSYNISSLSFKIKIFNQVNYEESIIKNIQVPTETLNPGWHMFTVVLDTVNGVYKVFVDSVLQREIFIEKGKFSFSTTFNNNFFVGTCPFYNGVPLFEFLNDENVNYCATNISIGDLLLLNKSLNSAELMVLYKCVFSPSDLSYNFPLCGSRDYIDSFSRTFDFSVPGNKSQFIDININDSYILDKNVQNSLNGYILNKLKDYLPAYVKVNKINWNQIDSNAYILPDKELYSGSILTNAPNV